MKLRILIIIVAVALAALAIFAVSDSAGPRGRLEIDEAWPGLPG